MMQRWVPKTASYYHAYFGNMKILKKNGKHKKSREMIWNIQDLKLHHRWIWPYETPRPMVQTQKWNWGVKHPKGLDLSWDP